MGEPMTGRTREVAYLSSFLDSAWSRPMFLALLGETGIGKSALMRVLADRAAERGFRIVHVTPEAGLRSLFREQTGPVRPGRAHEVLGDWRRSGRPVAAENEPALVTGMVVALESLATPAPLLVLLDRADATDAETRRLLTSLMRHLSSERVSLVLGARGSEPPEGIAPEITRYVVPPLDETASARLLGPVPGGPRREALRRAAGNPMLLLRLGGTPARPEQEYARLCAALPEVTRRLLAHADLAGESDPVEELTRAAGGAGLRDWEPAEIAGVITIVDGRVRFTHPMFRECLTVQAWARGEPSVLAAYRAGEPAWAIGLHDRSAVQDAGAGLAQVQLARPAAALDLV